LQMCGASQTPNQHTCSRIGSQKELSGGQRKSAEQ
jgi:hypothetical protein